MSETARPRRAASNALRRVLTWVLGAALVLMAVVVLYVAAAIVGAYWRPSPHSAEPGVKQYEIAVFWSPIHTDIILPAVGVSVDWRTVLTAESAPAADYLGFGWGSESFYRDVPTMADITPGVIMRALFFDRTVMHVTPIADPESIPLEYRTILTIPEDRLRALEQFVLASFGRDADGALSLIADESYGYGDTFYVAKGRYWPIRTCNQWTGEGLRIAGVPVGYWTPFSQSISWILGGAGARDDERIEKGEVDD